MNFSSKNTERQSSFRLDQVKFHLWRFPCGFRRAAWTHSAIIPCLKKLILFVGSLLRARPREASEEAEFAVHSNAGVELLRLHDKVAALR